jgi:hypothetical protein
MDSSSELSLQDELVLLKRPFIYEVRDEDGNRYRHCGKQKDADYHVMHNPGYTWVIVYLDPPPKVVDVTSETLPGDPQLSPQNILPENQQEPLDL